MIISVLAAAWQRETSVWDAGVLKKLLEAFARDVSTTTEHKIAASVKLIDAGAAVNEALTSTEAVGPLAGEALRIAIEKRQLAEFFSCWRKRPLVAGNLVPHEQTFGSKVVRLVVLGLVVLNVLLFVMLYIIPEFQKMFAEFGLEMNSAALFLMYWADLLAKLWFIPFLLILVLCIFFIRSADFGSWWRRWSTRKWTALDWHPKDLKRLVAAWKLRPAGPRVAGDLAAAGGSASGQSQRRGGWEQGVSAGVLTKSESAALSATDDGELKDWLLEKMITSKRVKRVRINNFWASVLLGVFNCFFGFVVLLLAFSIFGSLLDIIYALAGGRP